MPLRRLVRCQWGRLPPCHVPLPNLRTARLSPLCHPPNPCHHPSGVQYYTQRPRGIAFVEFEDPRDAEASAVLPAHHLRPASPPPPCQPISALPPSSASAQLV